MFKSRFLAAAASLLLCGTAFGDDLPLGDVVEGTSHLEDPVRYSFTAESAGALALILRGEEGDFTIEVFDASGQPVPDARFDIDFDGNTAAEQGMVIINEPGDYEVHIQALFVETSYVLGAAWLPSDSFVRPHDPQGSAAEALALDLDETYRGELDPSIGDRADWYRFEAGAAGTLTVATRTEEGDIALEAYLEDELGFYAHRSDQDLEGDSGHESIAIEVQEGDVYYFVVKPVFGSGTEYAIRGGLTE